MMLMMLMMLMLVHPGACLLLHNWSTDWHAGPRRSTFLSLSDQIAIWDSTVLCLVEDLHSTTVLECSWRSSACLSASYTFLRIKTQSISSELPFRNRHHHNHRHLQCIYEHEYKRLWPQHPVQGNLYVSLFVFLFTFLKEWSLPAKLPDGGSVVSHLVLSNHFSVQSARKLTPGIKCLKSEWIAGLLEELAHCSITFAVMSHKYFMTSEIWRRPSKKRILWAFNCPPRRGLVGKAMQWAAKGLFSSMETALKKIWRGKRGFEEAKHDTWSLLDSSWSQQKWFTRFPEENQEMAFSFHNFPRQQFSTKINGSFHKMSEMK